MVESPASFKDVSCVVKLFIKVYRCVCVLISFVLMISMVRTLSKGKKTTLKIYELHACMYLYTSIFVVLVKYQDIIFPMYRWGEIMAVP